MTTSELLKMAMADAAGALRGPPADPGPARRLLSNALNIRQMLEVVAEEQGWNEQQLIDFRGSLIQCFLMIEVKLYGQCSVVLIAAAQDLVATEEKA